MQLRAGVPASPFAGSWSLRSYFMPTLFLLYYIQASRRVAIQNQRLEIPLTILLI